MQIIKNHNLTIKATTSLATPIDITADFIDSNLTHHRFSFRDRWRRISNENTGWRLNLHRSEIKTHRRRKIADGKVGDIISREGWEIKLRAHPSLPANVHKRIFLTRLYRARETSSLARARRRRRASGVALGERGQGDVGGWEAKHRQGMRHTRRIMTPHN